MAKGNLFLGQAKGKVGSVVFSRAFGQQITRTKPTSVRNPKTIGQNTQRAILATIAKSAAAMTALVDHSFANVTYGAESVRHFRKINMGLLRNSYLSPANAWLNLSAKGGAFVPNYLKISEGNLPAFLCGVSAADGTVTFFQNQGVTLDEDSTVEDFLEAYPYIQGGDQLTVVKIIKTGGSLQDGDGSFTMKLDRIVFASNAFDDLSASFCTSGVINTNLLDLTKTTNAECLVITSGTVGGGLGFAHDGEIYASALILSRKVNDKWQRSTQFLEQVEYDDQADNESAIASYGASESITEATEYLNQADEGESRSGVSGAYMNVTTRNGSADPNTDTVQAGGEDAASMEAAAGTIIRLSAVGFDANGAGREPFFTIYKGSTQKKVASGSISYAVAVSAETAGTYKIEASFADRSVATYEVAISVAP